MTSGLLEDPLSGRHNSFTFLRLVFALMVVVGHSCILGGFGAEPLEQWTSHQLSGRDFAVQGFFVFSGFLIAKSLAEHPSLWRFAIHRAFRIFPALWCCLLLTALVLVPWNYGRLENGGLSYVQRITLGPLSAVDYLQANWLGMAEQYKITHLFADVLHRTM